MNANLSALMSYIVLIIEGKKNMITIVIILITIIIITIVIITIMTITTPIIMIITTRRQLPGFSKYFHQLAESPDENTRNPW